MNAARITNERREHASCISRSSSLSDHLSPTYCPRTLFLTKVCRTGLLLGLLLLLLNSLGQPNSSDRPPAMPALPRIVPGNFPPSMRDKIRKAYAAAQANPLDALANGKLGMILDAYSQSDERAEVCYRRARLLDSRSFRWAYYLAVVQAARGKYQEAITTLQEGLPLKPEYLPAQLKLAEFHLALGSGEEAREVYEEIIRRHPESAQAYFGIGRAEEFVGHTAAAITSYRKACELFPDFGRAHYALARAYQRLGQTDRAGEEFALAEKHKNDLPSLVDPLQAELKFYGDPQYLLQLGVELASQGKLAEAAAQDEEALQADPGLLRAHVSLISLYGRLHQFEKAEEHYREAVQLASNRPEIYYNYGVLLMEQRKYSEAEAAFRKVLEINPHHPEAHNNLGDILQRQGKLPDAISQFRAAVDDRPNFPQAHFNLGRILVNQENYKEAIEELLKTLSTEDAETKPSYLYAVGAAYARAGDRLNALRYLHLAKQQAAARQQAKLLDNIDRDLHIIETGSSE
jgi:tetratricopeptide (TPR) repeat protein